MTIYFAIVDCCMAVDAGSDYEAQKRGQISYHIYWFMWICQYQVNQELHWGKWLLLDVQHSVPAWVRMGSTQSAT